MITNRFNKDIEPSNIVLRKIVVYFRKTERPLFLGQIALEIGYSLEQTEYFLESLASMGLVQQLSAPEVKDLFLKEHSVLYRMIRAPRGEL